MSSQFQAENPGVRLKFITLPENHARAKITVYWAKLCAAATMAALPVVLAGWVAQNKLVRGLSFGAIK